MNIKQSWHRLQRYFSVDVWQDVNNTSPFRRLCLQGVGILLLTFKRFGEDQCWLKSSALTFLSSFAVVPFTVIVFGITRTFGFSLKNEVYKLFPERKEVIDQIFIHVEQLLVHTRGDLIALVGLSMIFYTVMRLLSNVERIFNDIWDIKTPRSVRRKFVDYTSLLLLSPLLFIFSSTLQVYLSTQIDQYANDGFAYIILAFLLRLFPSILLGILLSTLYVVLPNTKVKAYAASVAAVIATIGIHVIQKVYIDFQIGVSTYNAIYGSLAAIPLFLVWLQVSWAVVLLGAELAFSLQNARNHSFFHVSSISFRERKYVALRIMNCLCKCFKMGESCTVAFLVNSAGISRGLVLRALSDLEEAGLVSRMLRTKSRGMQYQPALDLQLISIKLVIDKLEMVGFTDAIRRFNTREDLRLQSILATNKEEDMDMLITDI